MLKDLWTRSQEAFEKLSRRERRLLLLVLTTAISAGWYEAFWVPLSQELARVERRLAHVTKVKDPRVVEVGPQDQTWAMRVERLVPQEAMADLVDRLTHRASGLNLVGFEMEPVQGVLQCKEGLGSRGTGALFRHALKLSWEGEYSGVLNQMHVVERLPWTLKADHFELEVTHFPRASVVLHLHFLSLSHALFAKGSPETPGE